MRLFHPARLLTLAGLAWSAWFLWAAFGRWRFERFCSMACGPFVPAEQADYYRQAFDWQTPFLMAVLPLGILGAWLAFRLLLGPSKAR